MEEKERSLKPPENDDVDGEWRVKCQIVRHITQPKIGKLKPLSIPKQKIYSISMDFMTEVSKVTGNDVIMVIFCRLNKWSVFMSCSKQVTAEEVAQFFLDNRVRHRGFPWNIVNDCGLCFKCNFDNT